MLAMEWLTRKFWPHVRQSGPGECWEWVGGGSNGYGMVYDPRIKRPVQAHRVMWEMVMKQPPRFLIHHVCMNKRCVNPEHLCDASSSVHAVMHRMTEPKRPMKEGRYESAEELAEWWFGQSIR